MRVKLSEHMLYKENPSRTKQTHIKTKQIDTLKKKLKAHKFNHRNSVNSIFKQLQCKKQLFYNIAR